MLTMADLRTERTCVGCRRKDEPAALVRLVPTDAPPHLAPDIGRKGALGLRGRGVWVHPKRPCVRAAVERDRLGRSLRRAIDLDVSALEEALRAAHARRLEGLLLAGARRRRVSVGAVATRDALDAKRAQALVVASDAAGRRDELMEAAARIGRRVVVFSTKSQLGRLLGREEVGVIGILDGGIASEVVETGRRLRDLSEAE